MMYNNKDIKEVLLLIAHREGLTFQNIIDMYNKKYDKNMSKQTFSKMFTNATVKYPVLWDILDSIGYTIEIKKKL